MRLRAPGGAPIDLAYCTNVQPAESVAALLGDLGGLWTDVRRQVGVERLGLGLWFPRPVATALAGDAGALRDLRDTLAAARLDAATVNAFPADAFHADVVKERVYRPDWLSTARFDYTLDAARVLAALAPEGATRTLSTLPLGYPKWEAADLRRAAARLVELARALDRLHDETGRTLRVALEPEPCCALESTAEAVEFFTEHVLPVAGDDTDLVLRHVGICLDLCHAAVEHEDPVAALATYDSAGVPVFKVQVSAALAVPDPTARHDALAAFAEPRWLHQVGLTDGRVLLDLPEALAAVDAPGPWRVHFHMPLHRAEVGGLPTTRDDVVRFLRHVTTLDAPPLLELETYTWSVVPGAAEDLAANVAAEIAFVREMLVAAGCTEDRS